MAQEIQYIIPEIKDLREKAIAAARNEASIRDVQFTGFKPGYIPWFLFGGSAVIARNVARSSSKQFYDLFMSYAEGDALEAVVNDRYPGFGSKFSATAATGPIRLSRATAAAGAGTLAIGTRIRAMTDSSTEAESASFLLTEAAQFSTTDLIVDATAQCETTGKSGNVGVNTATTITSTIFDTSITATNLEPFAGGNPEESDAHYLERALLANAEKKAGALDAIKSIVLAIEGVYYCFVSDNSRGDVFISIGDASGKANTTLIDTVRTGAKAARPPGCNPVVDGITMRYISLNITLLCEAEANISNIRNQARSNLLQLNRTVDNESGILGPGVNLTSEVIKGACQLPGVSRIDLNYPSGTIKCGFGQWLIVDGGATSIITERIS